MWFNKIKKKKMQFTVIAMILFMSTGILAACMSFALESLKYTKNYFSNEKCPIYSCIYSDEEVMKEVMEYEPLSELTDHTSSELVLTTTEDIYINSRKQSRVDSFVLGSENYRDYEYQVTVSEGEDKPCPADDEIWICKTFAKGFDVDIDDIIQFGKGGKEYRVSAIFNIPFCSSGFIDNYFFISNKSEMTKIPGEVGYFLNIYAKDGVSLKDIEDVYPKFDEKSIIWDIDTDTLRMCLTILVGIFGGVGTASGLLILTVSMIVIRYLIRASISSEYTSIGIYQAIGKTKKEIVRIYYTAYALVGVIASLSGIVLSTPISKYLIKKTVGIADDYKPTYITMLASVGVVLFTFLVLSYNVLKELKVLRKISPLEAINMNRLTTKEKVIKSVIKNAKSSFSIAVNNLVKNRGTTILTIIVLTVSIYANLFTSACSETLNNYSEDRNIWENLPMYDAYVSIDGDREIENYIKNSDMVDDCVKMNLSNDSYGISIKDSDMSEAYINMMVYENFTEERYEDVPLNKGRMCINPNEITASKAFLKMLDKEVGDYVTMVGNGKEQDFLIVGSYRAMMRGGSTFYMLEEDVQDFGFESRMDYILVFLKDGVTYEEFEKDIEEHATSARVYKDFEFIRQEGKVVSDIAIPIFTVIILAVSAFSILIIINLVYTKNRENKKRYGIMKAMGFTSGYIVRENIISLSIQFAISMTIAILLHVLISPLLFSLACGIHFIRKPVWLTVFVCIVMYTVLIGISRIMLISVKKISPVDLMEE